MRYGLMGAGPVHQYVVTGLPRLAQELDVVAALNRRSASRIVNTLRAGRAGSFEDLNEMEAILVCAPGEHCQPLLAAAQKTRIQWSGKLLVLCRCVPFSCELAFFRDAGASVATLRTIDGLPQRFLLEGDRDALRLARYLVQQLRGMAVEIPAEDYALYTAAVTLSSSLFTPLLEACATAIRGAGITASPTQFVEAMFLHRLRTFLYSGRKSWSGTVAEGNSSAIEREIESLAAIHPELANFYRVSAGAAARYLARAGGLTKAAKHRSPETA